ncbi:hypothetical protein ACLMJK_008625 [Lecanora helva]
MSAANDAKSSQDVARSELVAANKTLLTSGKGYDLTLKCRDQTFKVHKAIICSRSDFFSACCWGNFKEAKSKCIDLSDDDPKLLSKLLDYLYALEYNVIDVPSSNDSNSYHPELMVHASLYIIADKYGVNGLKTIAKDSFIRTLSDEVRDPPNSSPRDLSRLPEIAAPAIVLLYDSVVKTNDPLRREIQNYFQRNIEIFLHLEAFKDLLASVPDLSYYLLVHTAEEASSARADAESERRGRYRDDRALWARRSYSQRSRDASVYGLGSRSESAELLDEILRLQ